MKTLLAAVLLSTLAAPVLAMQAPVIDFGFNTTVPADEQVERRSGACPKNKGVAREGSTCGGV
jgi:hypothetical protein